MNVILWLATPHGREFPVSGVTLFPARAACRDLPKSDGLDSSNSC